MPRFVMREERAEPFEYDEMWWYFASWDQGYHGPFKSKEDAAEDMAAHQTKDDQQSCSLHEGMLGAVSSQLQ